jgi:GntR family transcriptional regulator / MocR family aminotransferase
MLPGLRIGFVVTPQWAKAALIAAKNCADWHVSTPLQSGIATFIEAGHLTRHVRKMRHIDGRRRAHLLARLRHEFAGILTPLPSTYGMHVTAQIIRGTDAEELAGALADHGVKIHSLARFAYERPAPSGLVFGIGAADEVALDRALNLLRKAIGRKAARK